jgi:hypothetical protein
MEHTLESFPKEKVMGLELSWSATSVMGKTASKAESGNIAASNSQVAKQKTSRSVATKNRMA